jgi:Uncharacterised nucleotidyltransferase
MGPLPFRFDDRLDYQPTGARPLFHVTLTNFRQRQTVGWLPSPKKDYRALDATLCSSHARREHSPAQQCWSRFLLTSPFLQEIDIRHYHLHYTKKSSVPVEIHWHIARPNRRFTIDIDGFWERAQSNKIAGVEALILSPEDLLLHLCQHMHKHKLIGGIRPLCDITHVVDYYKDEIDWLEFRTRSFEWGISPYAYLALYLAKDLLAARIPSSFLDGFEPPGFDRSVIDWAKERLLDRECLSISHNVVQLCWNGHRFKDRLAAVRSTCPRSRLAVFRVVTGFKSNSSFLLSSAH